MEGLMMVVLMAHLDMEDVSNGNWEDKNEGTPDGLYNVKV